MSKWSKDELRRIAETDDLHIAPFRDDGKPFVVPLPLHYHSCRLPINREVAVIDAPTRSPDERDAARLSVLCIDTVFSVSDMTVYKVEPQGRAFERENLIDYLLGLAKPIAIDVNREDGGRLLLRVAATKPPRLRGDVDPNEPRDLGEALCRHYRVDESALILVQGDGGARFTMRLAGLSLWDQSYHLHMGNWLAGASDPDEAARALGAVALFKIRRPGPEDVDFSFISLY